MDAIASYDKILALLSEGVSQALDESGGLQQDDRSPLFYSACTQLVRLLVIQADDVRKLR